MFLKAGAISSCPNWPLDLKGGSERCSAPWELLVLLLLVPQFMGLVPLA